MHSLTDVVYPMLHALYYVLFHTYHHCVWAIVLIKQNYVIRYFYSLGFYRILAAAGQIFPVSHDHDFMSCISDITQG